MAQQYPHECCNDPKNLIEKERIDLGKSPDEKSQATRVMRQCQVCGCRHYELTIEPITFEVVG